MTEAIVVQDLVKRYSQAKSNAVDGVSFAVRRGEIFGLLGPNGAGKTTTIGVLTTSVTPTSGTASVAGYDVAREQIRVKQNIAVVPQSKQPRPQPARPRDPDLSRRLSRRAEAPARRTRRLPAARTRLS